jgi:RNA polymerase sigma-70 factor, ECF subfamily
MANDRVDEAALLARARAKDADAFGRLVARYEESLVAVLTPIVGEREKARDCAQETALRAFQNLDRFVEEHRFSTWYFRIGVNLAVSARRRARLEERAFAERARRSGAGTSAEPPPFSAALAREDRDKIAAALAALPSRYAEIVRLRYMLGMSCQDIARKLKTTANSVSIVLCRAKQRLREELTGP